MRLATPQDVIGAVGIQSGAGSLAVAAAALDATFPAVEARLETSLLRARYRDWFDLTFSDTEYAKLRLGHAFVTDDEPVVVTAYGSALASESYRVLGLPGVVQLIGTFTKGRRVISVEYSAGFEKNTADQTLFTGLPESLKQGGISTAAAYLLTNPANSPKEKARFLGEVSLNALELKCRQALTPFTRPRGIVVWPEETELVE